MNGVVDHQGRDDNGEDKHQKSDAGSHAGEGRDPLHDHTGIDHVIDVRHGHEGTDKRLDVPGTADADLEVPGNGVRPHQVQGPGLASHLRLEPGEGLVGGEGLEIRHGGYRSDVPRDALHLAAFLQKYLYDELALQLRQKGPDVEGEEGRQLDLHLSIKAGIK